MTLTGTLRKAFATTLAAAMLIGTLAGCSSNANSNASSNAKNSSDSSQTSATEIKRGESHDPSIVKANGKYYIFGSRLAEKRRPRQLDQLQKQPEHRLREDLRRHLDQLVEAVRQPGRQGQHVGP